MSGKKDPLLGAQVDAAQALTVLIERVLSEDPNPWSSGERFDPAPRPPVARATVRNERSRNLPTSGSRGVPPRLAAQVWRRDGFRCRFCSRRLVPAAVHWALHEVAPLRFPMDRHSGPACHQLARETYADIEHVFPWKRGGSSRHESNLVASCERCNRHLKRDRTPGELGWDLAPVVDDGWEGLVWAHEPLIALLRSRGGAPLAGDPVRPYGSSSRWAQALTAPDVVLTAARHAGVTWQEERDEGYAREW